MARRHKKALDPISLEELTNAPAMSGFVSFLNVKPWEAENAAATQVESTPVEPSPVKASRADSTPASTTRVDHVPSRAATRVDSPRVAPTGVIPSPVQQLITRVGDTPVESTPVVSAESTIDQIGVEQSPFPVRIEPTRVESTPVVFGGPIRRPRIQEVRVLQDSMSFGEEALYNALWANAIPHGPETRRITVGFENMSRLARMTGKNCKLNCRALIEKKILETIAETDFREGRTYLVHGFRSALGRQREAGLTHVIRTRGVVFVDAQSGTELTTKQWRRHGSTPVESTPVVSNSTPVGATGSTPVQTPQTTPVDSAPHIRNSQEPSQTSSLSIVRDAITTYAPVDDDAVRNLVKACRERSPDATEDEVAVFVHHKGRALPSRVDNPLGWLLVYVPKCFPGELQHLRQQHRRQAAEAERTAAEMTAHCRQVLDDPDADELDKRLAREILG